MITPGFAVLSRLLLSTGTLALVAGMVAAAVEISHLL
jgi:hypothetical protein